MRQVIPGISKVTNQKEHRSLTELLSANSTRQTYAAANPASFTPLH